MKYEGYGGAFTTPISGFFSLALKILLFWLVCTKLIVIAEGDSNLIGFSQKYIDPDKINEVDLKENPFLVYMQIHDMNRNLEVFNIDDWS